MSQLPSPSADLPSRVAAWHDRILAAALERHRADPSFRFNLRTRDTLGADATPRLGRGFWFPGGNGYLFFAPFRLNHPYNKTRTVGFVVRFNQNAEPRAVCLELVSGRLADERMIALHQQFLEALGPFRRTAPGKFERLYEGNDPLAAFARFIEVDHPRMVRLIRDAGLESEMLVSSEDFEEMLARITEHRERMRNGESAALQANRGASPQDPLAPARNVILYGPPGTGKTRRLRQLMAEYTSVIEAADAATWKREVLASAPWRSVIVAALTSIGRPAKVSEIKAHEFVQAKAAARERSTSDTLSNHLWSSLQAHAEGDNVRVRSRREPFIFRKSSDSRWELVKEWHEADPDSLEVVQLLRDAPRTGGGSVKRFETVVFHPSYSYEDFVRGIRPVYDDITETAAFRLVDGVFKRLCDRAHADPSQRYALFIDEINRANIAKVFGELIALIEPDKRARFDAAGACISGMAVLLPGSDSEAGGGTPFGVPPNLDIFGSMNTADRSIAMLDVALRRRFDFEEMPPDVEALDRAVGSVRLDSLLERLNERLEFLLDADHLIGHSYLIHARTVADLRRAFHRQIIPLLREYFFDDLSKVACALSTVRGVPPFVTARTLSPTELFHDSPDLPAMGDRTAWRITDPDDWTESSFRGLYSDHAEDGGGQS